MGLHSGLTGYVKTGAKGSSKVIAHISSFSLELSNDILEDVSFGNTYKEKVPTIKDWTASSSGSADFDKDSGQKELYDAFSNATPLTFAFGITDTIYFEGTGYIESLSISNEADGKAEIEISISGTKGVTFVLPEGGE